MKRVLGIVPVLLALVAGAKGADRLPVLAVVGNGPSTQLAYVDPVSLQSVGRSAQVGHYTWPWARSPDGSRVVLARRGRPAALRVVDLHRMRTVAAFRLGDYSDVRGLEWVSSRRVLALAGAFFVLGVDPVQKRIVWRRTLPDDYESMERASHGLVFLVSPSDEIGPTKLVFVSVNGSMRSVMLERIQSGFHREDRDDVFIGEGRRPGLAIDTAENRAFVIGAGEPVAEVDLATMQVTYHGGSRTLAKGATGPVRDARWLGNGLIAVTGQDSRAWIDAKGREQEVDTPAGLTFLDTRDWTSTRIDSTTARIVVGGGVVLGYAWNYDSTADQASGSGVTAYSLDGSRRFHVLDGPIGAVQAGAGFSYIWLPVGDEASESHVAIVDLASGQVLRTATLTSSFSVLTAS